MEKQERTRKFEPWPWVLAFMLAAMIGTSLAFLATAIRNPDQEVARPGVRSTASTPPSADALKSSENHENNEAPR